MDLKQAVAVISGGASGLGEGCARLLIERGARGVVILDTNEGAGIRLAEQLGDRAKFAKCDISDDAQVASAVAAGEKRFGAINVLIAAAAIAGPAKLIGRNGPIEMAKFDMVMKVNLYGTLHLLRACVPAMQRGAVNSDGERGVVINVASGAAFEGQAGQIAYAASKAALVGLTMPLMRELSAYGIRVVTIAPGAFDTPLYAQVPPAVKQGLVNSFLFPKRMGTAAEFASFAEEVIRNPIHNGRTYRFDAGNILAPQ
jgi:3-hydroxyacyl-CoA dehydrogenase / 3-hydroxy-2-methylbutyryl-CoA dehydrogenase